MASKTFKQIFFKPGRYHVGGGRFRNITADDVADYVRGTQELLGYGHRVPLLYEHAAAGSSEGAPVQLSTLTQSKRDEAAEQVKHGAGWLNRVWLNEKGEAAHELEVTDPEAAKKLKEGSIKFTSPELRESFIDGKGRTFNRVFAHIALTHRPRNLDQSPIEETPEAQEVGASQFSLADWEPVQFSDMDEETGLNAKPADEAPDNPDLPQDNTPAHDEQQFQAVLQLLKDHAGVDLPNDTTAENFVPYLLTGLKTLAAVKEKQAQESAAKEGSDDPDDQVIEEKPPMQFSLADVNEGKVESKLLAAVMRNSHGSLVGRLDARGKEGTFPPALIKALKSKAETMQFSEEGDEQIMLSLSDVVDIIDQGMPKGTFSALSADQFSNATEEAAPENLRTPDGDVTPEQARAIVDKQAQNIPYIRKSK